MKGFVCTILMVGTCLVGLPVSAMDIQVSDDGYLPVGMGNWYWTREYAKSYNNYYGFQSYGFAKFDLAPLAGVSGDDVVSAVFRLYVSDKQGSGPNPYPAGTEGVFTVTAYDNTLILDESYVGSARPCTTCTATHDSGPDTWASIDLTDIVRDWLDGSYPNNGIEIYDGLDDDYGWYWHTREASANAPYLDVTLVPEPATMLLVGTGVLGALGCARRRRMR